MRLGSLLLTALAAIAGSWLIQPVVPRTYLPVGFLLAVLILSRWMELRNARFLAALSLCVLAGWFQGSVPLLTQGLPLLAGFVAAILLFPNAEDLRRSEAWCHFGLILAALLVAAFSGGAGGSDPMRAWLVSLGLSPAFVDASLPLMRKSIHVIFYGVVAAIGVAALRPDRRAWGFGLGFALALAIFDESRQWGIPTRSGSPWDVALDMGGALIGAILASRSAKPQ